MFRKLDILIGHIERFVIGFTLIVMTALIFTNVALRFFTGQTITWAEDLAIFLMICMSFFAAAYGTRLNRHITMSALTDTLSGRWKKSFYIFSIIVTASLSGFLFIMSLQVTRTIYDMQGEIASMGIPKYWPYLVVSVALLFMTFHFVHLAVWFFKTGKSDNVL
ncbi:MAG: TRAP transporter small permease, partial [Candidatus Binatia bacterium]